MCVRMRRHRARQRQRLHYWAPQRQRHIVSAQTLLHRRWALQRQGQRLHYRHRATAPHKRLCIATVLYSASIVIVGTGLNSFMYGAHAPLPLCAQTKNKRKYEQLRHPYVVWQQQGKAHASCENP